MHLHGANSVKMILVAIGVSVLALLLAVAGASMLWRRASTDMVRQFDAAVASSDRILVESDLEGLPSPVARYLRLVLRVGQPVLRSARLRQNGQFRIGNDERGWRRFHATQYYSVAPAGFVWDARINFAPFLNIYVRDFYRGGTASMRAAFLGVASIVKAANEPELNAGALHRYLAEAAWCPSVLLPGRGVTWESIDDRTARATIRDSGISVSLEFRFNEQGEIASVFAPARFRELHGQYVPTPWLGRFWRYEERHGIRVPIEGEVAWLPAGASVPYWRGTLVDVEYWY